MSGAMVFPYSSEYITVKSLCTDTILIIYNSKLFTTSVLFTQMFQFSLNLSSDITTEIQFKVKLFGDKHCPCEEG